MSRHVVTVYNQVIDDVIANLEDVFLCEGYDTQLLPEVKDLWKAKLQESGVLGSRNHNIDGKDIQKGGGGIVFSNLDNNTTSASATSTTSTTSTDSNANSKIDIGANENNKDSLPVVFDNNEKLVKEEIVESKVKIEQVDSKKAPEVITKKYSTDGENIDDVCGGDDELGSDLDDDEEELDTEDLVLCQYEKVTRTKTRRKCILKDGIVHIEGKEYVFHKGIGEFDW